MNPLFSHQQSTTTTSGRIKEPQHDNDNNINKRIMVMTNNVRGGPEILDNKVIPLSRPLHGDQQHQRNIDRVKNSLQVTNKSARVAVSGPQTSSLSVSVPDKILSDRGFVNSSSLSPGPPPPAVRCQSEPINRHGSTSSCSEQRRSIFQPFWRQQEQEQTRGTPYQQDHHGGNQRQQQSQQQQQHKQQQQNTNRRKSAPTGIMANTPKPISTTRAVTSSTSITAVSKHSKNSNSIPPRSGLTPKVRDEVLATLSSSKSLWPRRSSSLDSTSTNSVSSSASSTENHAVDSSSAAAASSDPEGLMWSLQRFAPPKDEDHDWVRQLPDREHHVPVERLLASPDSVTKTHQLLAKLPTLPKPLQRFYHEEGHPNPLQGMYPLLYCGKRSPTSILRKTTKTNCSSPIGQRANGNKANLSSSPPTPDHETTTNEKSCVNDETEKKTAIQFDPRVTVTEFTDDVKRRWITQEELEKYQYETLYLAQRYFLAHPDQIERYYKPHWDPVTKTWRNRPLFSLPSLSCSPDDSNKNGSKKEDEQGCAAGSEENLKELANQAVRNVLLVDPNTKILDLFRRTLHPLFPKAEFTSVRSGEDALQAFASSRNGFDVVVAEQCLQPVKNMSSETKEHPRLPPPTASERDLRTTTTSSKTTESTIKKRSDSLVIQRTSHPSLGQHPPPTATRITGSELFKRIIDFQERSSSHAQDTAADRDAVVEAMVHASSAMMCVDVVRPTSSNSRQNDEKQRRSPSSLLIGVSARPDKDADAFRSSGADLMWGKPPPSMNERLRDRLVICLVKKRQEREQQQQQKKHITHDDQQQEQHHRRVSASGSRLVKANHLNGLS